MISVIQRSLIPVMLVPVDIFNFLSSAAVSSFISVSVGQILVQMILDQHPIWNNDPMLGLGLHNHPDKLDHSDSEMEEFNCNEKRKKMELAKNCRPRVELGKFGLGLLMASFFVCFSNSTSPPWSSIGLVRCAVQCVPAYTLSSPAFNGVTHRMDL